jgi:hypothetical protein
MPDTPLPTRCRDCPQRATHGLVQTKRGWTLSLPVRTGARWCKAHGIAEATRRNLAAAEARGARDA